MRPNPCFHICINTVTQLICRPHFTEFMCVFVYCFFNRPEKLNNANTRLEFIMPADDTFCSTIQSELKLNNLYAEYRVSCTYVCLKYKICVENFSIFESVNFI